MVSDDNAKGMAIDQRELQYHERMVRVNLQQYRNMAEFVQSPGVQAAARKYMLAVRSHRAKATQCIQRWAWFAKRKKHERIRAAIHVIE